MIAGGKPNLIGISGKMGSGKDTLSVVINYVADKFAPESISDWEQPVDELTYANKKYSEKLKYMVCFLLGCSRSDLEDREFKEKELGEEWWYYTNSLFDSKDKKLVPYLEASESLHNNTEWYIIKLTPRKLLQLLGTEAGREIIHPNIWVNGLFADYVCDDCGQQECPTDEEDTGQMIHRSFPDWIITDVRFPNEAKAIKEKGGILIRINRPQYLDNGLVIRKDEHPSETALDDYDGFDYVIENDTNSVQDLVDKVKELKIV